MAYISFSVDMGPDEGSHYSALNRESRGDEASSKLTAAINEVMIWCRERMRPSGRHSSAQGQLMCATACQQQQQP